MKNMSVVKEPEKAKKRSGLSGKNTGVIDRIIKEKVFLSPLAGITDPPFRLLLREYGCAFAFTEMIDVNGLFHRNRKTFAMLESPEDLQTLGVQLVGYDQERILYSAKICERKGFKLLDLNAACPAKKVVTAGKGAALLNDTGRLKDILQMLSSELSIPVTLKIRSGSDNENINCVKIAKLAERSGVSAVSIHPRTQKQGFKGKPDHGLSRSVKEEVGIPVFVSGNIFSPDDAIRVLEETHCDAVIVARGVFGYPWIFEDIRKALEGTFVRGPGSGISVKSFKEIKTIMNKHIMLSLQFYDEKIAFSKMYKHVCWYLKRFKELDGVMSHYRKVKSYTEFVHFMKALKVDEVRKMSVEE